MCKSSVYSIRRRGVYPQPNEKPCTQTEIRQTRCAGRPAIHLLVKRRNDTYHDKKNTEDNRQTERGEGDQGGSEEETNRSDDRFAEGLWSRTFVRQGCDETAVPGFSAHFCNFAAQDEWSIRLLQHEHRTHQADSTLWNKSSVSQPTQVIKCVGFRLTTIAITQQFHLQPTLCVIYPPAIGPTMGPINIPNP